MKRVAFVLSTLGVVLLAAPQLATRPDPPSREEVLSGLRKAAEFFRTRVSNHGGYHFAYAEDFSYGRSEHGEGPNQPEVQRAGTPIVGMTYLDAYDATGDRYYLDAARETAYCLVQGQLCSGGWSYFIEFDPEKRKQQPYRVEGKCAGNAPNPRRVPTNLDDNVTQAAVRLLMRVDRALNFQDVKVHEAALFALDSLLRAQYPNGAWPQRYTQFPDPQQFAVKRASYPENWSRTWPGSEYEVYYTLNDNTIVDAIDMMLEAARIYKNPKYQAAAEKGGDFLLLAQMPDPQPGWAQQYDRDMHPAWARRFEPPSVTGGESQSVMQMLMVLYRETGNKKYLEPLQRALDYYFRSALPQVEKPSEIRARACPPGSLCLARFYELRTNRPLYITKGTRVNALNQSSMVVDGYELSYSDQSVITHYAVVVGGNRLKSIAAEFERVKSADPSGLKRPEKLRGLSPWSQGWPPVGAGQATERRRQVPSSPETVASRVRAILASMDERGAWTEQGNIGKAARLVSVFAAHDMTVTLGDKVHHMKENDTLQVFQGPEEPRQRIIRSQTFADNVEVLSAYLAAAKR